MSQSTLLELVQDILNESGGDEVNSISDTIEATSIATLMRRIYFEIVDVNSLPSTGTLRALVGLGDTDLPNVMQLQDNAFDIKWIKYDVRLDPSDQKNYRTIRYLSPEDFVSCVNQNPSGDTTNFQVVQWDANVPLIISKVKGPDYWTTFDDNYIVFDSYDSNVESTLQSSKCIYYSESRPEFYIEDDFIPEIPENLENLLYIKTLSRYLSGQHDKINPQVELEKNKLQIRSQRNKWRQGRQTDTGPDYGKK